MQISKTKTYNFLWQLISAVLLILTIILPMCSFRISYELSNVFPAIEIGIVFFLSIYSNSKMLIIYIITYSMMLDIFYGLPIGLSTIPSIVMAYILHQYKQILAGKNLKIILLAFIAMSLLYLISKSILFYWYFGYSIKLELLITQYVITIVIYPLIDFLLQKII